MRLTLNRFFYPSMRDLYANTGLTAALFASLAFAGESAVTLMAAGIPAECAEYASNVTQSEGNFKSVSPVVNGTTCYGAFQFCNSGTLQRHWKGSPSDFLGSPSSQVSAWLDYQQDEWAKAKENGMDAMIGQQVCYRGTCTTITQSSILKACQFGCGRGGKLYNLMKSGLDCNASNTKDGAGTSVCKYLVSGAGYNVSCITSTNDGIDCTSVAENEINK